MIVSAEVQNDGYRFEWQRVGEETERTRATRQLYTGLLRRLGTRGVLKVLLIDERNGFFAEMGTTVDQTLGSALAQIQVVARKIGRCVPLEAVASAVRRFEHVSYTLRTGGIPMSLSLCPLSPVIGVEIDGLDLDNPMPRTVVEHIHKALMRHLVVFVRGQDLTPVAQAAFARRFGRLRKAQRAAFLVNEATPEVAEIINDHQRPPNVNHYHSDGIFRSLPEFAAVLYAQEVPEVGGDTIFVNMQAAYDGLSDELRNYVDKRQAIHDFMKLHGSPAKARSWEGDNAARMDRARQQNPPVTHPMVRVHPVTGRRSLLVSPSFTTYIAGVSAAESQGILEALFHHCSLPEYQCRFKWSTGAVAFWDNRATMHYALADYWPAKRLMHRVTIETDEIGAPGVEGLGEVA